MMNSVVIDSKFMGFLGLTVVGTIFLVKMDADEVKQVSIHVIDSAKEAAIAILGD